MFKKISSGLTEKLIKSNTIKETERTIYNYGFELITATIIEMLVILLLALVLGYFKETCYFILFFSTLRTFAGGYHAKTYFSCFSIFGIILAISIFVYRILDSNFTIGFISMALLISNIIIWAMAPIDSENKPLSDKKKTLFRKISISLISIQTVLIYSMFFLIEKGQKFSIIATLGVTMAALTLIPNLLKRINKLRT